MGCPPDPIDVDIWRSKDEQSRVEAAFKELGVQKEHSLKLAEELKSILKEQDEFLPLFEEITKAIAEKEAIKGTVHTSDLYQDLHEAHNELDYVKQQLKNRENSLCHIRHYLLKIYSSLSPSSIPEKLRSLMSKEQEYHIEHREDDRQTWLLWIDEKLKMVDYLTREYTDHKSNVYLMEAKRKLTKEKERVLHLPVQILVNEIDSFGRNDMEFDIDYSRLDS